MKRILIVILALLVWMAAAAAESAGEDAMLVHLAEGEMTVRDAEGNILASEADMSVFSGYSIETGDDSYAYIYLDDGKTVKLDMNTLVTVSRSGGKALVELKSGQLAFFLTAPLGEDGEFLIRAGELETSVLGSSGVVALRKVLYGTGHGIIIYHPEENGVLPKSFDIWGGQLLELNREQDGTRIENAQVSDLPSVYLKEVEQNESLQQSLQGEGNYDVDELIAMVPVAEAAEQAARDAAAAAVVQPLSDDAATNPAFTKDDATEPVIVPVVPDFETVTVIWKNGTEKLAELIVPKGSIPKYSASEPTRAADAQYTYTFIGWDHEEKQVYENTVYYAEFKSTLRKYTIIWKNDDGSVIDTMTLEYGATPEHAAATKEETAQYTYTFAGWDPAVTAVAGDATYTATYDATVRTYTITWKDDGDNVIETSTLEYGATPEHAAPEKAATAEYTYTFTGWDPAVATVAGDTEYKATYDPAPRTYTITWKNEDGSVIDTTTAVYGATPEHAAPEKAATEEPATDEGYYTFTGWEPAVVAVKDNAEYTASYTLLYRIRWLYRNEELFDEQYLPASDEAPSHVGPEMKDPETGELYTFIGWSPDPVPVSGNMDYYPRYSEFEEDLEPIGEGGVSGSGQ